MANIKSAKKRILISKANEQRNKSVKSSLKTAIKKVNEAIASGDKTTATANLVVATSELSSAAGKGIIHKNNSSRKISKMSKAVASMQ